MSGWLTTCVSRRSLGSPAPALAEAREETAEVGLASLPLALLQSILSRLPLDSLAACACACRWLRDASGVHSLWECWDLDRLTCAVTAQTLSALLTRCDGRLVTLRSGEATQVGPPALTAAALVCASSMRELVSLDNNGRAWSLPQLERLLDGCPGLKLVHVDAQLQGPAPPTHWSLLRWALGGDAPAALRLRRLRVGGADGALLSEAQIEALCDALRDGSARDGGPKALIVVRQTRLATQPDLLAQLLSAAAARLGLRSLAIEYSSLSDHSVVVLARQMRALPHIRTLSLRGTGLGALAAARVAEALRDAGCGLHKLDLRDNRLRDEGAETLSSAWCADQTDCTLRELALGGNGLSSAGIASLARALAQPTCSLESLELGGSRCCGEGAAALARAMTERGAAGSLARLHLYHCSVDARGAHALAGALPGCVLAELHLGRNLLGNEGALALADALSARPPPPLLRLDLSYNAVGVAGAVALADALAWPFGRLTHLNLRINAAGDVGASALLHACVLPGGSLQALVLARNGVTDEGAHAIGHALCDCAAAASGEGGPAPRALALRLVDLRHNDLTAHGARQLMRGARAAGGSLTLLGVPVYGQPRAQPEGESPTGGQAEESLTFAFGSGGADEWGALLL